MSGVDDVEGHRRNFKTPHNARNPIPTIQKYREEQQRREEQYGGADGEEQDHDQRTARDKLGDAYNAFTGKGADEIDDGETPYEAENKNLVSAQDVDEADDHAGDVSRSKGQQGADDDQMEDTTEGGLNSDPKKARKEMKKFSADGTEREVTDPITHLPIKIHDFTDKDLKRTNKNPPPVGAEPKTMTGMAAIDKSDEHLADEEQESKDAHTAMQVLFPPPDFDSTRSEITSVYVHAITAGLGTVAVALVIVDALFWPTRRIQGMRGQLWKGAELISMMIVASGIVAFMRQWMRNRIKNVWDVEVWQAERRRGQKLARTQTAESTQWLNSLFASVWPLINPDLFTSISDTLEVTEFLVPSENQLTSIGRHASFITEHGAHGCSRRYWSRQRSFPDTRCALAPNRRRCPFGQLGRKSEIPQARKGRPHCARRWRRSVK